MKSPEWRSFAAHEMTQLDSDFNSVAHPAQDSASNRLLERDGQRNHISEPTRTSASRPGSHTNGSFVYSDATETHGLPSEEIVNQPSMQKGARSGYFPANAHDSMEWKGNAWYALTWEVLGIVVAICFLSKSCAQYTQSITNVSVVLGAFVVHLNDQQESAWSIRVIQATRLAPSLWPILFSGVLGNAIRALADWHVERGVDLLVRKEAFPTLDAADESWTDPGAVDELLDGKHQGS